MNKNLYIIGIFFLAITLAAGVFHSILLLSQEFSLILEQSYAHWFLAFSISNLIGNLFILRYFYFQQWKFVFVSGIIAMAVYCVLTAYQYYMFIYAVRQPSLWYMIVVMMSLLAGIVVGCGYTFSDARKNTALKCLGVVMIVFGISLLILLFTMNLGPPSIFAQRAILWLTAASSVFPLFYILVFRATLKATSTEPQSSKSSPGWEAFSIMGGAAAMITLIALLAIGGQLARESYWHLQWEKNGPEAARKLADRFEAHVYVNKERDTLRYLLMKPLAYDSTKKYPIVTCLHGGPTRAANNIEVTEPAPLLSEYANRKKYPAFIFVPQAGPGVLWGGVPGVPSAESLVSDAMDALEQEFSIDEERRYIAGVSGGGYGTWNFICNYPDRFAGAIPICGAGNPQLANRIVNVPVWSFHGEVDRNVPVTGSRDMIEAIRKAGGNPRYNEFPNVGHNVWPEVNKIDGVLDWLFTQRKSAGVRH